MVVGGTDVDADARTVHGAGIGNMENDQFPVGLVDGVWGAHENVSLSEV